MTFRDQLTKSGDYSVHAGRLHGPHAKLPLVVDAETSARIEAAVPRLDARKLGAIGLVLFVSVMFGYIALMMMSYARDKFSVGLLVFCVLMGMAACGVLVRDLRELRAKNRGAHLVLRRKSGVENRLWFDDATEATRVQRLLERPRT